MVNPRSEPWLWVQLISLGALPLELLLALLLLAGADPGPLPLLERILAWALGALAPALLLWRRPANVRSLLLFSAAAAPDEAQRQLARLQGDAVPRLLFVVGVVGLLPLLNWLDTTAALASAYSPLQDSGRLSGLMLTAALLAVMVWQWQQLVQSVWLLSRSPQNLAEAAPLSDAELQQERSNPGLPLLRLRPIEPPAEPGSATEASRLPVAVEPEQASEDNDGGDLDQEVG